jgi:hypothetical protein
VETQYSTNVHISRASPFFVGLTGLNSDDKNFLW